MAGIGDSWGTREELLHPRGPDGKWIRKGGIAKSIIDGVLGFLAGFRPRTFQNRGQASQYLQNITHRQGARRMGRVDQVRLARDLGPANADLRDGVIDEPSTKRFVDMMDRSATELPDDAILTRIVGPDAFGFTPQTAQGTNSDTDPGIRGMSGKLIADRGYGLTSIGGVQGTPPAGSVRMVIAAKKGTKVTIPAASPSDTTVFLERGQPMRVTKVEPDGVGGWTMYVTAEPGGSGREVPESIAGPVGAGRESSKDREARIRDTMQSLAKLDKTPDEQKEQEDEAARAARAAEAAKVTPVPSPQQEAERRRLEVAQQQQAPRQPAPGEPPPRTEPVVGRVGEPGTGVPPQAAPAPGTPEPTTAPRRVVDIRTAVRDAGIPSPSSGPELRQWNEAYLGLKSGKLEPDEAARNLDANIRHNRGLAEDLRSRPGDEARIADLEENIKAQEALRDLIREQYDLPAPAAETPPAPTPVKKAPAAPAVKRTAGGLPKQEGLTPVKKATPRKSAADRDVAARDTAKSWLEAAGVSESDLGDMDRTGVAMVSDLVARRRISKAEAVRRLRTDREGSLLNRIADAIEASPRKKAAKKAAPAKKAPAKKAVPRPAAEKPGDDLDKMTKADLIAEAGRRGVTARQSWTKDRIKKAIRDREEAGAQAPEAPAPVKKATKKAAPALSDQETQIRELFEGDKPTVVQLREYARINGMEPSDAVVSQGFMKPLSRMKREELIGLILTVNESERRFTGDRSVGRLPNASTLRQQIIATPEGNRGDMLDGVLAPLTQPQRRRLAKELGVRGQDRATNQGQILDAIREHFRGAVPEGAEAPAPVKKAAKAAVPGAVPGRIDRVGPRDINVGDEILIEAGPSKGASRGRVARIERSGKTGNNNRYQFFNEDGEMFRSMAPNGKTSVRRGGAPDREQAARDRQARIDRARSYGDVAAEIEELISGEVDNDVLVRGILRVGRGLPPEDLDQLVRAARSGNTNDVRLRMGNLLQAQGVNLFDRPGAIERFDRRRHELLGDDIPEGSMVHVVRPGVESTVDGEHLWLRKATVEVATPQETVREERAKRLVPEGSTQGARTDVPVDNALRKRELRKALMEADLPPASPGSARKAQQEIKDDLIGGRLTPEEAIRRLESEVEFLTEDANEVDANLRQTDLTDDERGKLLRHKAQLEASVESNKKHSEFLRKYFKGEGPVVSLEEAKVQDPVSYEFLKDATPDDLREAAKGAGLDAPSGDTPDEMFRDLIKQVAKKELDRRAAKKAAKKVPAKKVAKKAAPEVPRDKERVDARLLAEGLGLQDDGIVDMAQRALDGESVSGTPKNPTPRQIADMVDGHARHLSDSTAIRYGNWFDRSQPSSPNYDPEFAEETRRNFESGMARAQALRDFAERIRGVRRKKATPAKAATPEVAKLQDKVDDLEKRRIDDALKELTGAKSKEQRDAALEGLTLPELRRLAEQAGVGHARTWRSKLGVREGIIAHFFPETPTPVPGDRDAVARRLGIDPGESGAQGRLLDRVVDGEITEDQARQILSTSVAEQMGATGPQQGGNVLRQPNMPLSRRASGAGIQTPGRMFSDVDSAVTDADVRLRNGESHTDVARRLRERAARVAKADIMEEGRRFPTELDRDTLLSIRKSNAEYLRRVATHVQQEGKASAPAKKAPAKKAAPVIAHDYTTFLDKAGVADSELAPHHRDTLQEIADRYGAGEPAAVLARDLRSTNDPLLARVAKGVESPDLMRSGAPAKKAAPAAPGAPSASRTGTSPVGGTKSTAPEIPNNWGMLGTGGDVEFHDDGVIGQRLRQMGDDRLMDVDGEPLSNVIGKLATRAIRGQISQEQLLMDLDRIYKRLPAGSRAKGQVKSMMEDLDAPARAMPDLPDGTPAPFRTAMERLLQIPVARDAVDRPGFHRSREDSEVDKLLKLIEEFQEGRTGGLRMIDEIQEMRRSLPHESQEGRFEADRVLRQLHDDLDALFKNPDTRSQVMRRTPGAPPTAKKATPRLTAIPGEGTGRRRGGTRPTLRVVRNEDGEFSLVLVH